MIVRLKEDDTSKVSAVTFEEMDKSIGVVVDANDAPVTLSNEGQKVFVATAGRFSILVSSQNGPINPGDYVTISALSGIGMRAGEKEPIVVGRALDAFNGTDNVVGTTELKDSANATRSINLGRVTADITVLRNPNLKADEPNVPEILKRAAETIAGKPVDAVRIYLGLIIFTISTVISGTLLYGGIRSGIISIGRNPLSKKSIVRSMLQVILTGLIIFITGVFGVYLLLKL
jgi:hypothetical protein